MHLADGALIITSIKTMKLKGEVGMGGPKSTQTISVCRDNHVHYTSLHPTTDSTITLLIIIIPTS